MIEFKKGDIVQLKSGGPKMTVEIIREDLDEVRCSWFKGEKRSKEWFSPEALQTPPLPPTPIKA